MIRQRVRRIAPPWSSRLLLAAGAAVVARGLAGTLRAEEPVASRLLRTNYRGATVSLAGGPALALAAAGGAAIGAALPMADSAGEGRTVRWSTAAAVLTAGATAGAVGLYDDMAGARPDQKAAKGFHGHLAALRRGQITAGLIKIAGVGAGGLAAASLLAYGRGVCGQGARGRPPRVAGGPQARSAGRLMDIALGAGVIAGTANLINLLDLRPGRALKASLLVGGPLIAGPVGGIVAAPVGAAGALLAADLGEELMLGDSGANAIGAVLGVALAARTGRLGRATLLAGIAALTGTSEKISFTKVIERTPGLRELDKWGRREV